MDDLISRQDAIKAIWDTDGEIRPSVLEEIIDRLNMVRSAEPKKGKWILVKGSNGKDYHKCSECFHEQEITGVKNFCAVCGADMREE